MATIETKKRGKIKGVLTEHRYEQMRNYNKANYETILKYQADYKKKKMKEDPLFRLECNIRRLFMQSKRNGGYSEKSKLCPIIGMPYADFLSYIEGTWTEGMSWDNYGNKTGQWSIDHITAPSTGRTEDEILSLFHFLNTRAMWAADNIRKSNK